MKIHLVSEHASPLALLGSVDAGGQNVHVASLATALARHGAQVVVHTRRDDPTLEPQVRFTRGVVVNHVDAGPAAPLAKDDLLEHMPEFARRLEESWELHRPDVVHAHFWMSGLASMWAAQGSTIPVALTFHALGSEKQRHQGAADTSPPERQVHEQWLATTVDHVIATTDAERRTLLDMGTVPERVTVIPCGVDRRRFHRASATGTPAVGRRPRVLCLSRLVPRKGIEDVIRAVAAVPDVELLIAGGPPAAMLAEDAEARRLSDIVFELGVQDRAVMLGAVERTAVPDLIRSCDIVCCTPWYEPFGLVAVEAMACGVPVVATAVGGLAETVGHCGGGVLVPPHRPDEIAAAISSLISRPEHARKLRAQAAAGARDYGWTTIGERTLAVLGDLAAARAAPTMNSAPDPSTLFNDETVPAATTERTAT